MNENKGSINGKRNRLRYLRSLMLNKKKKEILEEQEKASDKEKKEKNNSLNNSKKKISEVVEIKKKNNRKNVKEITSSAKEKETVKKDEIISKKKVIVSPIINNDKKTNKQRNTVKEDFKEKEVKREIENQEDIINKKIKFDLSLYINELEYRLRNIEFDYHVLKKEERTIDDTSKEEADELLERIKALLKELESIKKDLDINKYSSFTLYKEITDYIGSIREKDIKKFAKINKLYSELVERIENVQNEAKSLEKSVEEKKNKLEISDEEFENKKNKFYDISYIEEEIRKTVISNQIKLEDIKKKVDSCVSFQKKQKTTYLGFSDMTASLIAGLAIMRNNPSVPPIVLNAMKADLVLHVIGESLFPRKRIDEYQEKVVIDYQEEIANSLSNVDNASKLINGTLKSIEDLINDLSLSPNCKESDELLYQLGTIKDSISKNKTYLDEIKNEMGNSLTTNKIKMKVK